jgi:hypothetical protein
VAGYRFRIRVFDGLGDMVSGFEAIKGGKYVVGFGA